MQIADRKIGTNHPSLLIAGIGFNDASDLCVARHMVSPASCAGAKILSLKGVTKLQKASAMAVLGFSQQLVGPEEADLWARRPGSGDIPVFEFDSVIGKRLTRAVTRNTQLKWSDLA